MEKEFTKSFMNQDIKESINRIKENTDFTCALNHFKAQLDSYLKTFGINDLESFGFELRDSSKDKSFELRIPTIGNGNTDLMILVKNKIDKRYNLVNIELIPTGRKIENLVSYESLAQLISANVASDYPVLQVTTNLREFEYMMITKKNGELCQNKISKSKADYAIPMIIFWLNRFHANSSLLKDFLPSNAEIEREITEILNGKLSLINSAKKIANV